MGGAKDKPLPSIPPQPSPPAAVPRQVCSAPRAMAGARLMPPPATLLPCTRHDRIRAAGQERSFPAVGPRSWASERPGDATCGLCMGSAASRWPRAKGGGGFVSGVGGCMPGCLPCFLPNRCACLARGCCPVGPDLLPQRFQRFEWNQ